MRAHRADYAIATLCRVRDVSISGYRAWLKRGLSPRAQEDARLAARIKEIHEESKQTYGAPRVHAELVDSDGAQVGVKRVARLMAQHGLRGLCRRRFVKTTVRAEDDRPVPDLVDRDFTASAPDALWVADITAIPTWQGFLYLAVVLDVFSRRIVGWSMATHMRAELVLAALEMAIEVRRPAAVIHHSDQGAQYTSLAFGQRCRRAGPRS